MTTTNTALKSLSLKRHEDKRLRAGHCWIFSNEVDTHKSPLTGFEPGEAVLVEDSQGKCLGTAYVNAHSLICARIISRAAKYVLNKSLLVHRINVALSLRQRCFDKPFYRLIYSESDGLPGLIVDRFDDILVAQITTAGMERVKDDIVAALKKVVNPRGILWRNDTSIRQLEGMDQYIEIADGEVPQTISVEENQTQFEFGASSGQKTGWFYDHRLNRQRLCQYVKNQRILDVFSYIGGWGIEAAHHGAAEVLCIDSSQSALEQLHRNAALNGVDKKIHTFKSDAFEALKQLRDADEKFDIVVIDPPAFIKRKKDHTQGVNAYLRINQIAMQLLNSDGLLLSASCSYHLKTHELNDALLKAARHLNRNLQIIEQGHQGPDHPIHPAIAETAYLKSLLLRITKS